VQDKREFYLPDGAPAFRDDGKRLTGSENRDVVRNLVNIARMCGWEEITVDRMERFLAGGLAPGPPRQC
jgi:hypothetical protein